MSHYYCMRKGCLNHVEGSAPFCEEHAGTPPDDEMVRNQNVMHEYREIARALLTAVRDGDWDLALFRLRELDVTRLAGQTDICWAATQSGTATRNDALPVFEAVLRYGR